MSTIAVDNVKPSAGGTSVDLMAGLVKAIANTVTDAAGSSGTINQTSITDGGVGTNTHTFTNSFASVDYGHTGNVRETADNNRSVAQITSSDATGSCLINIATDNGTNSSTGYDVQWVGDLA
jgi:hypothetical protein